MTGTPASEAEGPQLASRDKLGFTKQHGLPSQSPSLPAIGLQPSEHQLSKP